MDMTFMRRVSGELSDEMREALRSRGIDVPRVMPCGEMEALWGRRAVELFAEMFLKADIDTDQDELGIMFQRLATLTDKEMARPVVMRGADKFTVYDGSEMWMEGPLGSGVPVRIRFMKVAENMYVNPEPADGAPFEIIVQVVMIVPSH
jgi:hypothetical protein